MIESNVAHGSVRVSSVDKRLSNMFGSPRFLSRSSSQSFSMSLKSETVILLLTIFISAVSGVRKFDVTPDRGTTLTFSSSQPKGCQVCTGSRDCKTSLTLKDTRHVSVEFTCATPQDAFTVEIVRSIECTTRLCSSHIIQADSTSSLLQDFQRRFTWNINAQTAFKLDFNKTGLRQINPSERCPDKHTYTLQALQEREKIAVGKYCTAGTISSAQILNQGSFSVDVPAGQKLQHSQFNVSVGEEIKSLAKISVTLSKGPSFSELLPPNYPDSFPDDDVMQWYFHVPDKHVAAVRFLNLTEPMCLKKRTAVEYHSGGRGELVSLNGDQPVQNHGNFSLTLRNCEMDRRRASSPGLSLRLSVSTSRSSSPVLCKVDPSKTEGLSLHINNVRPDSECEMKINSETRKDITVTSSSELSFQDCLPRDVQVTATRVVECHHKGYKQAPVQLRVPLLPSCLPTALSMVTWTLRPCQHGTVGIMSPTGLIQDLPGQPCDDRDIIKLSEEDGPTIGDFCSQGAIQKVLIHTNVSVTWRSSMGSQLPKHPKDVLSATFESEISERYIFRVAPPKNTSVLVATPGWYAGMDSYSTVSWIVSVPSKMKAYLMFTNVSQPKCSNRHTNIRVQRIGKREEDYSRREDEEAESEITISESFYLNMSNCMPETGRFSVLTKITLHKRINLLLTIILSVVATLLVLCVIVLVVVCMVVRKKKKQLNEQVDIYNPNNMSFPPGYNGFPKSREDNESHVYASIEDTLVYTHLLKKGAEIGIYEEYNAHKSCKGRTDSQKPPVSKDGGNDNTEVHQTVRLPSQQGPPLPNRPPSHIQTLVDNEIYQKKDQSEEESSLNLGPRLEPEGGN